MEMICSLDDLGWLVKNFGLLFIVVVFFVWRDYRREDKLTSRVEQLEREQTEVLMPLVQKTTKVIAINMEVIRRNTKVMERLENSFSKL